MSQSDPNNPIYKAVLEGNQGEIDGLVEAALVSGQNAQSILDELIDGIHEVGRLFGTGEYFIPDLLLGAKAMKAGLRHLEPELAKQTGGGQARKEGKVLLGTIKGDLHDIGKSLVGLMLEVNGFDVRDIGVDVPVARILEEAESWKPDVIGLSSLLTTTALEMGAVTKALTDAEVRDNYFVVIGGAATTSAFAEQINADGWAENATEAVKLVKGLMAIKAGK
jgi:5-methyltetrahydrofolate--homocysteine methyltransferase